MTRTTLALAAVASLLFSGSALAGDYHKDGTLKCAECHVMHFSVSHAYTPNGTGFSFQPISATPNHFLLRAPINDLCLSCHDNLGFAPDVLGSANTGNGPSDVRLAGFLNRLGDAATATGHTLDSTAVAPGSTGAGWNNPSGLKCNDCHHHHGAAGSAPGTTSLYRNLRRDVGQYSGTTTTSYVTYNFGAHGSNDLTRDVFERQNAEYDEADVDWNEPNSANSAIAVWCGGCHGAFHGALGGSQVGGSPIGPGGAYEEFVRHPAAGVNIGAIGGGHSNLPQFNAHVNKVKVMSPTGVWGATHPGDVTPTCISCHKGHGNGNPFGLIYRQGTGTLTENGDTVGNQVEDLCGQCHRQGNWYFQNP